jgi:DNA-binding MltR family transcriptional regulator
LLDDLLTACLSKRFCISPTEKEVSAAFRFEGPLGTFSAKMEVACLFGFIEDETYQQLYIIREMRNACAHSKRSVDFSSKAIINVVRKLFGPLGITPVEIIDFQNGSILQIRQILKYLFLLESMFVCSCLFAGSRLEGEQFFKTLADSIGKALVEQKKDVVENLRDALLPLRDVLPPTLPYVLPQALRDALFPSLDTPK